MLFRSKEDQFRNRQLDIQDAQRRDIAAQNNATKLEIANKEGKEIAKEKRKEDTQIHKENRKLRGELDKAESNLTDQLARIQDAKETFNKYSKGSVTGTGPIATAGGLTKYVSQKTEALDSKFKNLSFDELTKKFAGMSKAIDSDGERRAFESTQPNITLDDDTNRVLLEQKEQAVKNLLEKTKAAKARYDREGRFTDDDPMPEAGDRSTQSAGVMMRGPDGKARMIPADQVDAALKAGGVKI